MKRNYLRKLTLAKVGLNKASIDTLTQIVKSSKSIISLDISWNRLTPGEIYPMLQTLSGNRRL